MTKIYLRRSLILFTFILISSLSIKAAVSLDRSFLPALESSQSPISVHKTQADGKIVIGGPFRLVNGELINRFGRINADGSLDETFDIGTGPDSEPRQMQIQPDGKILIAGLFSVYNGISQTWFARVNADGSLDASFAPVLNGSVNTIEVQNDGKILIGGSFSDVNGMARRDVARLNLDGTLDTTFDPGSGAFLGDVDTMALQGDGKILVGGSFNSFNGQNYRNLVRLNTDGSVDTTFNTGDGPGNRLYDITVQTDGKILIGGTFNTYNGTTRNLLARINSDGTLDTSLTATFAQSNSIYETEVQTDGKIIVVGNFSSGITRLNSNGTPDATFIANTAGDAVLHVDILPNGQIVFSGGFVTYNGTSALRLARVNSDGSLDPALSIRTGFLGSVNAIAIQNDGKIIIGGGFLFVNNVPRRGIARLNADGTTDETFDPGTGVLGFINDIKVQADGKIYIAGNILTYNNIARADIVRLNANGSVDTSFDAGATSSNAELDKVLITSDGKVFVVGLVFSFNGTTSRGIAKFNADGSLDTNFTSGLNSGRISAIGIQNDSKIVIGGLFSSYGGVSRNGIARLNSDGTLDTTFDPGSGASNLFDLKIQTDGKVVIVGAFSTYDGVSRNGIARANTDGSLDTSFDPGTGFVNLARKVELDARRKILVSGDIISYNGMPVGKFVRINPDGSFDTTFNIGTGSSGGVFDIEIEESGDILAGGFISTFNGVPRGGMIRLNESLASNKNFDYDGDGKADISIFRPSTSNWWVNQSTNGSMTATQFGISTDRIVPADYDGDGRADIAVYRDGIWYLLNSSDSSVKIVSFGLAEDKPSVGDFDGDGKADLSVFRPSSGIWYRLNSSDDSFNAVKFGISEDIPTVGDFDGDGRSDIAVWRPTDRVWYQLQTTDGFRAVQFGISTDQPAPADYDGDGKTDIAVYRNDTGVWYLLNSQTGFSQTQFGLSGDIPVAADYDGDGKADIAVWRPGNNVWYLLRSQSGFTSFEFGLSGDKPTPAAYN